MGLSLKQTHQAARLSARSSAGIFERMTWDPVDEVLVRESVQDVEPVLKQNAELRRESDEGNQGYSPSRELRRVATIPTSLLVEANEDSLHEKVVAALDAGGVTGGKKGRHGGVCRYPYERYSVLPL